MAETKKSVQKNTRTRAGKTGSGLPVSGAKSSGKMEPKRSGTPYFVLIILVLITVILVMFNKFREKGSFITGTFSGQEISDAKKRKPAAVKEISEAEKNTAGTVKEKKNEIVEQNKVPESEQISTKIYFLRLNETTEKLYLASVNRKVSKKDKVRDAIRSLIAGPTKYESGKGYVSAVPSSLGLRSVRIESGNAVIDFSGQIESGAAGEILLKRIKQIVYTATEFGDIGGITIHVNGRARKTIGADGLFIGGSLKR